MSIDFIYFDVGGVVILDFSKTNKWNEMLFELGLKPEYMEKFIDLFDPEETKFCLGEKDTDSFVDVLKNEFGLDLPEDYSFLQDLVNRFEPNPKLGEIILKLKDKYRIGLLTNMYVNMLDEIKERKLLPDVGWDVVLDSSKVHLVKPQSEIYKLAEKMAGVSADKVLFVENNEKNVDAAKALGWKTYLYDPSNVEKSNKEFLKILS